MQIILNPVINDWGYIHPEYFDFGGREWVPKEEWNAWLEKENLEEQVHLLEYEESDFARQWFDFEPQKEDFDYDLSKWEVTAPEGEGWFIGSIFDTEDGPYCIWLRNK